MVILGVCLLGFGLDYWLQRFFKSYQKVMMLEFVVLGGLFLGLWCLRSMVLS